VAGTTNRADSTVAGRILHPAKSSKICAVERNKPNGVKQAFKGTVRRQSRNGHSCVKHARRRSSPLAGINANLLVVVGMAAGLERGLNRGGSEQGMTAGKHKLLRVVGVTALMLAAALGDACAQSSGHSERGVARTPANPQSYPAPTEQTKPWSPKPWSLDDALPDNSPAAQTRRAKTAPAAKPATLEPAKSDLGRVPLRNGQGTFGLETETKVKSTVFPDGRPAPGVETTPHKPPSYFGLSISVPTTDK